MPFAMPAQRAVRGAASLSSSRPRHRNRSCAPSTACEWGVRDMNHPARLKLPGSESRAGTGDWLYPLNGDWPSAACHVLELETEVVRVAVASVKGSAPREAGTSMLVAAGRVIGTIGGGHLEWEGIRAA